MKLNYWMLDSNTWNHWTVRKQMINKLNYWMLDSNTWNHWTVRKQMINMKLNYWMLDSNTWNHWTLCKQMIDMKFNNIEIYTKNIHVNAVIYCCLPYYLPIAGGRIIGFIPFPEIICRLHDTNRYWRWTLFLWNMWIYFFNGIASNPTYASTH